MCIELYDNPVDETPPRDRDKPFPPHDSWEIIQEIIDEVKDEDIKQDIIDWMNELPDDTFPDPYV